MQSLLVGIKAISIWSDILRYILGLFSEVYVKCYVGFLMFKNTIYQNIQVPISLKGNTSSPLQVKFYVRIYVKFLIIFLAFYIL
jgi:hypothetical protein